MPSEDIPVRYHQSTKALPYVYKCTHKTSKRFYFGFRSANVSPPEIDIQRYKTSNRIVKESFDEYDWEILAMFYDKKDAFDYEQLMIYENSSNPDLINRKCYHGKETFLTVGKTSVRDSRGNTMSVFLDDPRLKSGELVPCSTGYTVVNDSLGNRIRVPTNDPRILSGEFTRFQTGRKWMNNGVEMRLIDDCKIKLFESKGYVFGKLLQVRKFFDKLVWLNDGTRNKRVTEVEVDSYLNNGWVKGQLRYAKAAG